MLQHKNSFKKFGFTLVELMASIAIITVIISVVVYDHQKFDSNLELTNVAYRIAIAIREAQVYGISVKQFSSNSYGVPYGVSFKNTADPASKTSFVFFGDTNPLSPVNSTDVFYDQDPANCVGECIERISLGRGNYIQKVCYKQNDGNVYCLPSNPGSSYAGADSLNIVFKRPKPDAVMTVSAAGDRINPPTNTVLVEAAICLSSPTGKIKKISVYSSGQISVGDPHATGGDITDPCYSVTQVEVN